MRGLLCMILQLECTNVQNADGCILRYCTIVSDRRKIVFMAYRTTAFEAADALGWDIDELARRSGVPASTLYMVRRGVRGVGSKTMLGLRRAFPQLSFEQLFVLVDNTNVQKSGAVVSEREPEEVAA